MIRRAVSVALGRRGYRISALVPPDLEPAFVALYKRCAPYTMTSIERMYGLWQATRYAVEAGIPGDVVECGVWRGGSAMLAAYTLLDLGDGARNLYLYDTFEGMTEPSERDGTEVVQRWRSMQAASQPWAFSAEEEVRANMTSTGFPAERIRFVRGPVEETLPERAPMRIALLRLDTDWYESTHHELVHLFPRLSEGGVLIVDDYGHWRGARAAVDEYFRAARESPLLVRLDYTGRIMVKHS